VCKGNVGKPPAKFIWKKLRHGEQSPIIYSNVSTTSTEIPGNCAFNGTSNLTIQLTGSLIMRPCVFHLCHCYHCYRFYLIHVMSQADKILLSYFNQLNVYRPEFLP
jgi:hypothetical protein